jgi:hypothetical protein
MKPPAANCETFMLDFGGGVRLSVCVNFARLVGPAVGWQGDFYTVAQTGQLRRKQARRCLPWFAEIFSGVSARTNKAIVAILPNPEGPPLALVCEPTAPPEWVSLP